MNEYLNQLNNKKHTELTKSLKEYATTNDVPIMEDDGIFAIKMLIRIMNAKKILEIGTAIGYSAIMMASEEAVTQVDTIERDEKMYNLALENIKKANLDSKIRVHFGDALEISNDDFDQDYDIILIDAAKAQYQKFFDKYTPLLRSKGMVITDNILFHGCVEHQENLSKNVLHMVKKIDSYNQNLSKNPDYESFFLPLGDGQAISIKR